MARPEVEVWREMMRLKAEAKEQALGSLEEAKLAEENGRGSTRLRERVAELGMDGVEGERAREALAVATALVDHEPGLFAFVEGQSVEEAVAAVSALRGQGNEDLADLIAMYIMAKWEPQNIGGAVEVELRRPGEGA